MTNIVRNVGLLQEYLIMLNEINIQNKPCVFRGKEPSRKQEGEGWNLREGWKLD